MNNNDEQILPIGTVIITKEGNIPLMIVSRAALFEKDGEIGYFDYSAVPYLLVLQMEKNLHFLIEKILNLLFSLDM